MRNFEYVAAASLKEAGRLLRNVEGAIALAGGTDVMVARRTGRIDPSLLVDLSGIPGLAGIEEAGDSVIVGALTSMTRLARSPLIQEFYTALAVAAGAMGCWQVRNLATVGGNLCNASPSAETAPPLLVFDAVALLDGVDGPREVKLSDFFTGPGKTALKCGEVLAAVRIPKPPMGLRSAYHRRALRRSMDIPLVNAAVAVRTEAGVLEDARVALGAVAATPFRVSAAEMELLGRTLDQSVITVAAKAACCPARPITDVRASADYRLAMVEVVVRRALLQLSESEETT